MMKILMCPLFIAGSLGIGVLILAVMLGSYLLGLGCGNSFAPFSSQNQAISSSLQKSQTRSNASILVVKRIG
jgi:hypothetical protein